MFFCWRSLDPEVKYQAISMDQNGFRCSTAGACADEQWCQAPASVWQFQKNRRNVGHDQCIPGIPII